MLRIMFFLGLAMITLSSCHKKPDYEKVRIQLEKVYDDDQRYRENVHNISTQMELDQKNTAIVTKIIDSLGWLGENEIGHKANMALFLVIQHSPKLETMEKYLPKLREAANHGKADKKQLAYLIDRVEILNNRPQIYGTQFQIDDRNKVVLSPLKDSVNIEQRRKEMNMEPLSTYLKNVQSNSQSR